MTSSELPIRDLDPATEDLTEFIRTLDTGFLNVFDPKVVDFHRPYFVENKHRIKGVYDGDRCIATFRSFDHRITVPGGVRLDADGITSVSVSATHRRRGLLSRMMRQELDEAVARGQSLAILVAAEWPIYGRFGFGPATQGAYYTVNKSRAAIRPDLETAIAEAGGRVELVDADTYTKEAPAVYERFHAATPGTLRRFPRHWDMTTRRTPHPRDETKGRFFVLHRDASGTATGALAYQISNQEDWPNGMPNAKLTVFDLVGNDPIAEAALWRYCLSVDWVGTVATDSRAADDVLPQLLVNARHAHLTEVTDMMWLKVLDVPAALQARTYRTAGTVVLRISDPLGHATGTFRLTSTTGDTADGTATCTPTDEDPDLLLSATALGALYLGGESAARLLASGEVTEARPGGAARVDLLFGTDRKPWTPDGF